MQAWFAEHMPGVTTKLVSLSNYYGQDDPETWEEIKANGDAAIVGVGHCSTCAPAVADARDDDRHASTACRPSRSTPTCSTAWCSRDARVQRPAAHAPTVFVPQPVMGKTADELRAYVDGKDPITGRPVMQEVDRGADHAARAADSCSRSSASTPRLVEPDTEDNLHRLFLENNWTDKLPIVLPTEERVAAMLRGTSRKPRRGRRPHAADGQSRPVGDTRSRRSR